MLDFEKKTILYAANVAVLEDDALYNAAYARVSEARKKKTDSYRFQKDRFLSLGAELLLQYGLKKAGQVGINDIRYGDSGKPFFENSALFFNLSHSEEYAVCAISSFEVGCDIEKISDRGLNIAKRFFFKEEFDDIASCETKEEQSEKFFRYWTLKESFMKVTGLGMSVPLGSFKISLAPEITVEQTVDERKFSFKEFGNIPGYRCAVCTADDCRNAELVLVDLKRDVLEK